MTHALRHTEVMVTLSLNVVARSGSDTRLAAIPLIQLTPILFFLWAISQTITRQWWELATLAGAVAEALDFTGKVLAIGFKSVSYGLGVML